jgi:hypothetical protein
VSIGELLLEFTGETGDALDVFLDWCIIPSTIATGMRKERK